MLKYGNLQPIVPSLSIRETCAKDSSTTKTQSQVTNTTSKKGYKLNNDGYYQAGACYKILFND